MANAATDTETTNEARTTTGETNADAADTTKTWTGAMSLFSYETDEAVAVPW